MSEQETPLICEICEKEIKHHQPVVGEKTFTQRYCMHCIRTGQMYYPRKNY